MYKTRFRELGYEHITPGLWRIIALDDKKAVGPHYRTRIDLLADLVRYAREYGCDEWYIPDSTTVKEGTARRPTARQGT